LASNSAIGFEFNLTKSIKEFCAIMLKFEKSLTDSIEYINEMLEVLSKEKYE